MEEIPNTAEAYYSRLSPAEKQKAVDIFRSMDANGDGAITFNEYVTYCKATGSRQPDPKFFNLFDKNGDGSLDFEEFLSLHYLVLTSRLFMCDGCGVFLTGVYFTCSRCFHTATTYELCISCYKNSNAIALHRHSADAFIDSYAMLLIDRQIVIELQKKGKGEAVKTMIQAFSTGVQIGSLCSIM